MSNVRERVAAILDRRPDATAGEVAGALASEGFAPDEVRETFDELGDELAEDDSPLADNRTLPSGERFYPETLLDRSWWVNWVLAYRYDVDPENPGDAKPTKQPVAPYRTGDADPVLWNAGLDDDEHPATDRATVVPWDGTQIGLDIPAPDRVISDEVGVGIIIPVEQTGRQIMLIDWDDVRDPETGETHPVCVDALQDASGWAEISQSGKGIHQFVFGEIPDGSRKFIRHIDDEPFIGDDLPMVEMYASGRLVAMTGNHVAGTGREVV